MIKKFIRLIGAALLLGGFAGMFLYMMAVKNSGTVVATATVQKSSIMEGDEGFKRYLTEYTYNYIEFAPMSLSPDMGDLKLVLKISGRILPKYSSLKMLPKSSDPTAQYQNLKSPVLTLTEMASGKVILTRDNWISTTTEAHSAGGVAFKSSNTTQDLKGEGTTNGVSDYNLGHVTVPAAGEYLLSGEYILFRKALGMDFHNSSDFSVEVRSGAIDFDKKIAIALGGLILAGAILCALTKPKSPARS